MPRTQNRLVMIWLFVFSFAVTFLIVFGGFVRLTRAGLSIVEWNPISGVVPPIGEQAWQTEFSMYQQTPEFQTVNSSMTMREYQYIFYIEWIHRLLARLAGLLYAIPVFYLLFRRSIPIRESTAYVVLGLLFILQAFAGWYMVASGLIDRPAVSHSRLTLHLLLALAMLGLSLWLALGHKSGFRRGPRRSVLAGAALASLALLVIQIAYGGLTAGLKAGHLSDTWPLMFGTLVPPGLFSSPGGLVAAPATVLFIHRWLAFAGLAALPVVYWKARRNNAGRAFLAGLKWLAALAVLQVVLGVLTLLGHVQLTVALLHQASAVALFSLAIYLVYQLSTPTSGTRP
jgi:cytochrome c oxidase assembly protein subunit 15